MVSTLTIRKVDEDVKRRLQVRGAANGRAMEAEVRAILDEAVSDSTAGVEVSLGEVMPEFRRRTGGVELDLEPRGDGGHRPVPDFS